MSTTIQSSCILTNTNISIWNETYIISEKTCRNTHFHLYLCSLFLTLFACSVVVYTSPVYDPGLSGSNTLPSAPLSLILTLLHAVWWSTHPQCMTPAFGIKRTSVCISVPCLLPWCMQCGGLHIPRVWPRPSGLYLCSSPLCLAICSNVMTLKITPRLWLTDN